MPVSPPKTGLPLVDRALVLVSDLVNRLERILIPRDKEQTHTFVTTSADELVRHGLGAPIRGFLVVHKAAAGDVYEGSAVAAPYSPTEFVNLRSSTAITVRLVFW